MTAGTRVTLTAPSSITVSGRTYVFASWRLEGAQGQRTQRQVVFSATVDTAATAVYKCVKLLKVLGPAICCETGRVTYACTAYFTDGTSKKVTSLARWREGSRYMRFDAPGRLRAGAVPQTLRRPFTVGYGGAAARVNVTIVHR
jgi:hypothetical protein